MYSPGGWGKGINFQLFYFVFDFILMLRLCFIGFSCNRDFLAHYEFLSVNSFSRNTAGLWYTATATSFHHGKISALSWLPRGSSRSTNYSAPWVNFRINGRCHRQRVCPPCSSMHSIAGTFHSRVRRALIFSRYFLLILISGFEGFYVLEYSLMSSQFQAPELPRRKGSMDSSFSWQLPHRHKLG